ncbi:energy transducer TonB [Chryseobacterium vrystaatense]|uniref:TonB protein C-terminal n=1 Tax=Chryseobacterium vrystaatense TaxID=307480 RepID=A0A1M4UL85_9FLAO|nr:hypothetical protein [Chryseobacterium vrystaatense]SHE57489.1 TonB protein C-terminal [Chryseobacterium vrystaatense]
MKKITFFFLVLSSVVLFSQTKEPANASPKEHSEGQSVQMVDKQADYPGGIDGFRQTAARKVRVSHIKGVRGKVQAYAKFSINVNGEIEDLTVTGENKQFNREVEVAVKSMKTKWTPGEYKGTPVKTMFTLPFVVDFE